MQVSGKSIGQYLARALVDWGLSLFALLIRAIRIIESRIVPHFSLIPVWKIDSSKMVHMPAYCGGLMGLCPSVGWGPSRIGA